MSAYIIKRVLEVANHIIDTKDTIRETAKKFNISKSTVHKDITHTLKYIDTELYLKVKEILDINKRERHLRGGEATRKKYITQKCRTNGHITD